MFLMPFDVNIPNADTLKALRDIEEDRELVRCKDADEMFEKLGILLPDLNRNG